MGKGTFLIKTQGGLYYDETVYTTAVSLAKDITKAILDYRRSHPSGRFDCVFKVAWRPSCPIPDEYGAPKPVPRIYGFTKE